MTLRVKLLVGVITVLLWGLVGGSMLGGSWHWVGVGCIGMALFRAVLWVRQMRYFLSEDEEE